MTKMLKITCTITPYTVHIMSVTQISMPSISNQKRYNVKCKGSNVTYTVYGFDCKGKWGGGGHSLINFLDV